MEAKGRIYEQSVYEFNEIAEGLDTMVAKIPNSKLIHEKQICDVSYNFYLGVLV